MSDETEARALRERFKTDTKGFANHFFKFVPDAWQEEAFAAWDNPKLKRIAMQACAGPGKSVVEAICAWQFLVCQGEDGQHPEAYAMSVTGDNLRDNLWKEIAVLYGRHTFLRETFEWQKQQIVAREAPATWFLRARSWSKSADPEAQGRTLSGLHAKHIAYFIDEAGDIPPSVLRSAEQGLTTRDILFGKIMMAGNPTSHDGALYLAANAQSDRWKVIPITGDPDDPRRSPRVDIDEARMNIATYGRDNPWVMAYILGKFPPSSINALLGPDEVRAAMDRTLADHVYINLQKRIGVDVARFGDDRTVLFPRQGLRAFDPVIMRNARTDAIAGRVALARKNWEWEIAMIDDTGGYGAGVIDQCRLGGIDLLPVNFSSSALDPRYFNRRSEMYFEAAQWIKNGGWLPKDQGFVREACAAVYWYEKGKLRVEEKDQIKKKLQGQSPDLWDAFMLTFALPDFPANVDTMTGMPMPFQSFNRPGKVSSDWDPFEDKRVA